ncbi:MAG: ATP-binding cassette domain-containing protein, partial [Butyrivibrio sp.]|nr:ATP-binding cassette domain-containing protein [Butyrivibrio sp.]
PETGKKVALTKRTAQLFKDEAVAFYEPLALKKLGIPDLLDFMMKRLSYKDVLYFVITMVLATLMTMLLPFASERLTGSVLNNKEYSLFFALSASVIVIIFFSWLLNAATQAISQKIKWKINIPVEQAVMQRMLTMPVPFFRDYSAGELASRSESLSTITDVLINDVLVLGVSLVTSLGYLFHITNFAESLVLPAVVIIIATVLLSTSTTFIQMNITTRRMDLLAKENGLNYSILNGIQKIKLSGAEKRIFAKWADEYAQEAALAYNPPLILKVNTVVATGISLIGTVVFYAIAIKSKVTTSEYYAFNIAYTTLFAAFLQLTSSTLSLSRIKPILEMAEPILKTEPEKTLRKELVTRLNGSIELGGVYFRYSENAPYILENFNLKIKAGEYVAIVGKTGCGKSTLVRLMLGFEKPVKGVVFYDGKDIERIDLKSLRRRIGSVIQDAKLFYGDIYQNIAIASEKLSMDEAWEAAKMAGIADDIRAMPMGMNTIISEGQGGISGGQRQRILIARAVASKPIILIFDEATSALDNITQKQISNALDGLKCTRIVIAHRLSTIKNCDRILVLDQGKVVEQGKYEELMEKKGMFYDLVERQQL